GRLELRLAAGDDPQLSEACARFALHFTSGLEELLSTVPPARGGMAMLASLAGQLASPDQRLTQIGIYREALARDPHAGPPLVGLARDLILELGPVGGHGVCADERRADCEREINQAIDVIERAQGNPSAGPQLRASFLSTTGHPEEAERLLTERCERVSDRA